MIIKCPQCSQSIELRGPATDQPIQCPSCGTAFPNPAPPVPLPPPPGPKKSRMGCLIFALGAVAVLGVAGFVFGPKIFLKFEEVKEMVGEDLGESDDREAVAKVLIQLKVFESALNLYRTDAHTFPSNEQGLEALVSKPTKGRIPNNYVARLEELPLDPWGNPYQYSWPPRWNKRKPDIWSTGPDGESNTHDDVVNWDR